MSLIAAIMVVGVGILAKPNFSTGADTFAQRFEAAGPVILEPVVRIVVTVPIESQGDVLGDVGARRGRVVNSYAEGARQHIEADVPMAELGRYAMDLRSMTAGRGTYWVTDTFDDTLPQQLAGKVLAKYQH